MFNNEQQSKDETTKHRAMEAAILFVEKTKIQRRLKNIEETTQRNKTLKYLWNGKNVFPPRN